MVLFFALLVGLMVGSTWAVLSRERKSGLTMNVISAGGENGGTIGVFVISGDGEEARPVPGAVVSLEGMKGGSARPGEGGKFRAITNRYGFARLQVPSGSEEVQVKARYRWFSGTVRVSFRTSPRMRRIQTQSSHPSDRFTPPPSHLPVETDKATYLPLQKVQFRTVALRSTGEIYPGAEVVFEVRDPAGNLLMNRKETANEWGIAFAEFPLSDTPAVGEYTLKAVLASDPNLQGSTTFSVQTKPREVLDLAMQTDAESYRFGETVSGVILARYFFGKPVSGASVALSYSLPEEGFSGTITGKTDSQGKWNFSLSLPEGRGITRSLQMRGEVRDPSTGRVRSIQKRIPILPQTPAIFLFPEETSVYAQPDYIRVYAFVGAPRSRVRNHRLDAELVGPNEVRKVEVRNVTENVFELTLPVRGFQPEDYYRTSLNVSITLGGVKSSRSENLDSLFGIYYKRVALRPDLAVYSAGSRALVTTAWDARYPLGVIVTQTGAGSEIFPVHAPSGKASTFITMPKAGDRANLVAFFIPQSRVYTDLGGLPVYGYQQVLLEGRAGLEVNLNLPDRAFLPGEEIPVTLQTGEGFIGTPSAFGVAVVDRKAGGTVKVSSGLARVLGEVQSYQPALPLDLFFAGVSEEDAHHLASILYYGIWRMRPPGVLDMPVQTWDYPMVWIGVPHWVSLAILFLFTFLLAVAVWGMVGAQREILKRVVTQEISPATAGRLRGIALFNTAPMVFLGLFAPLNALCFLLVLYEALRLIGKPPLSDYLRKHLWISFAHLTFGGLITFLFLTRGGMSWFAWIPLFIYYGFFLYLLINLYIHPFTKLTLYQPYKAVGVGLVSFLLLLWLISRPAYMKVRDMGIVSVKEQPSLLGYFEEPAPGVTRATAGITEEGVTIMGDPRFYPGLPQMLARDGGTGIRRGPAAEAVLYQPPEVRKEFPETLLWLPALATNFRGKATFSIPLAHNITTWEMLVVAHDKTGRFGRTIRELQVFQDFFVDAELPSPVYEGDTFDVPATVFNYAEKEQKVVVRLEGTRGLKVISTSIPASVEAASPAGENGSSYPIEVAPGGVSTLTLRVQAEKPGLASLRISAQSAYSRDAVEKSTLILPTGMEIPKLIVGRAEAETPLHFTLPTPEIGRLDSAILKLFPTPVAYALDGLESMLQEPYGCFEQTTSVNYPNILILRYLKASGKEKPEVRKRAENLLLQGYQKLLTFQASSGGFSLYPGEPVSPALSALGLHQLVDLKEVLGVGEESLKKVVAYFQKSQSEDGSYNLDDSYGGYGGGKDIESVLVQTAFVQWALTRAGYGSEKAVQFLLHNGDKAEDSTTLSLLALALAESGEEGFAGRIARSLIARAQESSDHLTYWSSRRSFIPRAYATEVQATALAVLALARTGAGLELIPSAIQYLVRHRSPFGGWGSTYDTVSALRALSTIQQKPEKQPLIQLSIQNRVVETFKPEAGKTEPIQVSLLSYVKDIRGNIPITITTTIPITAELSYRLLVPWEEVEKLKLPPGDFDLNVRYSPSALRQGDITTATVRVNRRTPGASSMVILEIPIPTGLELIESGAGGTTRPFPSIVNRYEILGKRLILYLSSVGIQPVELKIPFVAYSAGVVSTGPARVYEYYNPAGQTVTAPLKLVLNPG